MAHETGYDAILNLPHHTSKTRPQMPMADRAAQFSPFAALTGYDAVIRETRRLTDEMPRLDDSAVEILDRRLRSIAENIGSHKPVTIAYFVPDSRKAGGTRITHTGTVKKLDTYANTLIFTDGTAVPFDRILDIADMESFGDDTE